jgi:hypothetical protein
MDNLVRLRVFDFLNTYGDKGFIVLKTIVDLAFDPSIDHRLGDFNYRLLVMRLRRQGVDYNPINILRILEKDYGLIEKSYDTRRQKWWRLTDPETIRRTLYEYTGNISINEPRLRLILLKYKSLEPNRILSTLRRLAVKPVLSSVEKELYRNIVFRDLDKLASIVEEMMKYNDVFSNEINVIEEIFILAEKIADKIEGKTELRRETIVSSESEGV